MIRYRRLRFWLAVLGVGLLDVCCNGLVAYHLEAGCSIRDAMKIKFVGKAWNTIVHDNPFAPVDEPVASLRQDVSYHARAARDLAMRPFT